MVMVNGAACTVSAVLPLTAPAVAEIVVVPRRRPRSQDQSADRRHRRARRRPRHLAASDSACSLSEYVPVAVNCCVPPIVIVGLAGVTAIDVRVGAGSALKRTSTQ